MHATANWDPVAEAEAEATAAEAAKVLKVLPPPSNCDPEGEEPCGADRTNPHMDTQFRSALTPGGDPRSCVAKDDAGVADDEWCITNCGFSPPNCPPTLCRCGAATDSDETTTTPLLAPAGPEEIEKPLDPSNSSELKLANASKNISAMPPKIAKEAQPAASSATPVAAPSPAPSAAPSKDAVTDKVPAMQVKAKAPAPAEKDPKKQDLRPEQPGPSAVL
jgi:hypothetical protein